jgi:ABC-2 type transport system permease protein
MSGLFAQSTLFASSQVAVAVATDMNEGVIDRFKTLPIARSSILIGRSISTIVLGLPALGVMILCALAVGWRPENGIFDAILGFLLIEVVAVALSWLGILAGLIAKSSQAADVISSIPVFLLGFVSNVFVDTSKMPVWLRVFADWNPVSAVVAAGRNLFGNTIGPPPAGVWSLEHPEITTIGLALIIIVVFIPICVRRYSRTSR